MRRRERSSTARSPAPVSETTVFKSVGLAVEDIATARLVYEATQRRG
jgi:ornithine cyclodeaminase/alanine dehydrogenase-like protein (mu-crystallin family)